MNDGIAIEPGMPAEPLVSTTEDRPVLDQPSSGRPTLIGLSREELTAALAPLGVEGFRTRQLWQWIYNRGARSFAEMTTLAKPLRAELEQRFTLDRPAIATAQVSRDGTWKWLLRFPDRQEVETVHIPETDRGTLCVSSQVGCTLTCRFCHTGTQRLVRNLGAAEILGQVMVARDTLGEWPSPKEDRRITNVVLMGMGEPLYNFENVKKALLIAMDGEGLALSRRKITLSTSGVVPMMRRCGEEIGCNLAISLHAVTDELRNELVPLNRKYPIAQLMQACRDYPGVHNARRITFEYVMLRDVNDSDADARALVALLRDVPAKVNLIPFNPWPGAPFERSTSERIQRFSDIVVEGGYASPVRRPRGQDILAACGQLKSASVKRRRSDILAEQSALSS